MQDGLIILADWVRANQTVGISPAYSVRKIDTNFCLASHLPFYSSVRTTAKALAQCPLFWKRIGLKPARNSVDQCEIRILTRLRRDQRQFVKYAAAFVAALCNDLGNYLARLQGGLFRRFSVQRGDFAPH